MGILHLYRNPQQIGTTKRKLIVVHVYAKVNSISLLIFLLLPYYFWTFTSLYSLDFYFPFLFGFLFPTSILIQFVSNSIAVTHLGFFDILITYFSFLINSVLSLLPLFTSWHDFKLLIDYLFNAFYFSIGATLMRMGLYLCQSTKC